MYFWKINLLVEALKKGELTDKHKKKYNTFFNVLLLISIWPYISILNEFNKLDLVDLFAFVFINIIGILIVHKINKNGDNKDFGIRYVSLLIPLYLRNLILYFILLILGYIIIAFFFPMLSLDETNIFDVSVNALTVIILYFMMIKYFKEINA